MGAKKICLVLKRPPSFNKTLLSEAMRMGVGLTMRDHEVYLILLDDSLNLLEDAPDRDTQASAYTKHLEGLIEFGQTVVVEEERMRSLRDLCESKGWRMWPRQKIIRFMSQCDITVIV